jgi:predicted anti-sigma-YlaC factor YlaD
VRDLPGQLPFNDCDRLREHVSASLDGELSQLETAALQAHLAVCASCRTFADSAGATSSLLQATPLEELEFPVVVPGRRLVAARKLQVAAAAAALVVTVGLSAAVGTLSSTSSSHAVRSASGAKLRFPEQELRMLQRASVARSSRANHSRMSL